MPPPVDEWTIDYYTGELGAAAVTLDLLMAEGEVTPQQVWELVDRFPPARRPAAYSFLISLKSRTALQKYAMQIEAQGKEREFMAKQARDQQERMDSKERELRAFWVGLFLLILPIIVGVLFPNLSENADRSIRISSAAGLALLIAFIPGLFSLSSSVNAKGAKFAFRATGAMAGLAMVYFFDPATMSKVIVNTFSKH